MLSFAKKQFLHGNLFFQDTLISQVSYQKRGKMRISLSYQPYNNSNSRKVAFSAAIPHAPSLNCPIDKQLIKHLADKIKTVKIDPEQQGIVDKSVENLEKIVRESRSDSVDRKAVLTITDGIKTAADEATIPKYFISLYEILQDFYTAIEEKERKQAITVELRDLSHG